MPQRKTETGLMVCGGSLHITFHPHERHPYMMSPLCVGEQIRHDTTWKLLQMSFMKGPLSRCPRFGLVASWAIALTRR